MKWKKNILIGIYLNTKREREREKSLLYNLSAQMRKKGVFKAITITKQPENKISAHRSSTQNLFN